MITKNKINTLIFALIIAVFVFGFLLNKLITIPFGFLFNLSFFLFIGIIILLFMSIMVKCFRSKRKLVIVLGTIPLIMWLLILTVTAVFAIDGRIIMYKGPIPELSSEDWTEDIEYLSNKITEVHPNMNSTESINQLTNRKNELIAKIPSMSDADITMETFKLVTSLKDGHTIPLFPLPQYDMHAYPIRINYFIDGWYITDAGRGYKKYIYHKVIKIGTIDIGKLYELFTPYLSAENESGKLERFTYFALMPEWLKSVGAIHEIELGSIVLEDISGKQHTLSISPVKYLNYYYWRDIRKIENSKLSVFSNKRKDPYKFERLEDSNVLYIQCNEVSDEIADFSNELSLYIKDNQFDRTIIDLRNNLGGDDRLSNEFVKIFNKNNSSGNFGKLFILIGRHTFSSGVTLANKLYFQTNGIFLGESTAQGSVFYANPTFITLPNSKYPFLISTTSTTRSQASFPFKLENEISPHIEIGYYINDFIEGRDPILKKAINWDIKRNIESVSSGEELSKFVGRYKLNDVIVVDISMENDQLNFVLTDFIPNSLFLVNSNLYHIDGQKFGTDINNVFVYLLNDEMDKPYIQLSWNNQDKYLNQVDDKKQYAMEILNKEFNNSEDYKNDIKNAVQIIGSNQELYKAEFLELEYILNTRGYALLYQDGIDEALEVFKLNVELFPLSYNAYDSYGEALFEKGLIDMSIENYKKSVELNPNNKHGFKQLNLLEKEKSFKG